MTTIPLATVVSYLTRKGVDPVEALEGAPIHMPPIGDGLITFEAPDASWGDGVYLYLGRDAICPAAMGWAAALLATAVGRDPADQYAIHFDGTEVDLYKLGDEEPCFWWAWRFEEERTQRRQNLIKPAPSTPAERLRAVLNYEMGRA